MANIFRRIGSFFLDVIEVVVIALAIFVIVYLFLFQPHQVRGNSMFPNFHDKEYILTDKISYRFREPGRGDVIIFKAPKNEQYEYIKRTIGLPGEEIKISEGRVFINNEFIHEPYLPKDILTQPGLYWRENQNIALRENEYFVLGDNRSHSSDSRDWGPVDLDNIVGRAWFRYWPLNNIGIIKEVDYEADY